MIEKKGSVNVQEVDLQDESDMKTRNVQLVIAIKTLNHADVWGALLIEAEMTEGMIDGVEVLMCRVQKRNSDVAELLVAQITTTFFIYILLRGTALSMPPYLDRPLSGTVKSHPPRAVCAVLGTAMTTITV